MSAKRWSRRRFLGASLGGLAIGVGAGGLLIGQGNKPTKPKSPVWIGQAPDYRADLASLMDAGLGALGVGESSLRGKRVLLKPNLVEPHLDSGHINTHPEVVRAAALAFRRLGAEVWVGEGPGHQRDTQLVLEESGLAQVLHEERLPFVDLNYAGITTRPNAGGFTALKTLSLPGVLTQVDWLVSVAKLKTHHWAGVTLGMKNLYGLMPGSVYGWPKNALHYAGLQESILDINATARPDFCIVDGIVGMEGDGPIMGSPKQAGVLVMGPDTPAVDATCARLMGIDPAQIQYLAMAAGRLGQVAEERIEQLGQAIRPLRKDFALLDKAEAHQGIRWRG